MSSGVQQAAISLCDITLLKSLVFLAELLLCYLTGNIFGVEISCGQHMDDTKARFWVRFHWRMMYVIWMLSVRRPHGATALHKAYWLTYYTLLANPCWRMRWKSQGKGCSVIYMVSLQLCMFMNAVDSGVLSTSELKVNTINN